MSSRRQSAHVRAFPLKARRDLVVRIAAQMIARPSDLAEQHLQQQLQRQFRVLARKQVSDVDVEREIRALESAIRAELWRQVLSPPTPLMPSR
jgi:Family of unknown function (DUF6074)